MSNSLDIEGHIAATWCWKQTHSDFNTLRNIIRVDRRHHASESEAIREFQVFGLMSEIVENSFLN